MDYNYEHLGDEIKDQAVACFDRVFNKVDDSPKKTGLGPLFNLVKTMKDSFLENIDHDEMIEMIVNETHDYWDYVKERDEKRIIDISNEQIRECGHTMISQIGEQWFNYILNHRRDFFSEAFEEGLWLEGDSLIRKVIKYIHLRRKPIRNDDGSLDLKVKADGSKAPRYQVAYASKISVTKNALIWGVELV